MPEKMCAIYIWAYSSERLNNTENKQKHGHHNNSTILDKGFHTSKKKKRRTTSNMFCLSNRHTSYT